MFRRIISLCISIILLITICFADSTSATGVEYILNEEKANEYHTKLVLEYIDKNYPENYGGAYINTKTGNLVINLTERTPEIEQFYYDICEAEYLEFRVVDFSLSELIFTKNQVLKNVTKAAKASQIENIGSSIIQQSNSVEIYTDKPFTQNSIIENKISKHMPTIDFKVIGESVLEQNFLEADNTSVSPRYVHSSPGKELRTTGGSSTASFGYWATYWDGTSNHVGFVTAGHAYPNGADVYNDAGIALGEVLVRAGRYDNILTGENPFDFAFVELNSGITLSRNINGTMYEQAGELSIPAENSMVYLSAKSGVHCGLIYSLYFEYGPSIDGSYEPENNSATHMKRMLIHYDFQTQPGDSGGLIYVLSGGQGKVVGIHQSGGTVEGQTRSTGIIAAKLVQDFNNGTERIFVR